MPDEPAMEPEARFPDASPEDLTTADVEPQIFGIKAKLFWALATLAALTAVAGAVAVYGFFLIDRTVTRITADSIPTMAGSLRIAEQSAQIAAIAPALMASNNHQERVREQTRLEHNLEELGVLTRALEGRGVAPQAIRALRRTQAQVESTLAELDHAVAARLDLEARREAALKRVELTHNHLIEALEPIADDAYFDLIMSGEHATQQSTDAITGLIDRGINTIYPLLVVNAEANLAAGMLVEAGNVYDAVLIQPIRELFTATVATIRRNLRQLSELGKRRRLEDSIEALLAFGSGRENVFELRASELAGRDSAAILSERRLQTLAAVEKTHEAALLIITPLVDDAIFDLVMNAESVTGRSTEIINDLIDSGVEALHTALTLGAEGNLAAGLLAAAAGATDTTALQPLRERFVAAAGHIGKMLDRIPTSMGDDALRTAPSSLIDLGMADGNLFELRRRELDQIDAARAILERSRVLAVRLVDNAAALVKAAQQASDAAAAHAVDTVNRGKWIMILLAAIGISGAAAMILYYVGPRIIRPLEAITMAMSKLAGGDTGVDIPGRERRDEIGRMAQALGVFRDTAIELQRSNLAEIRTTRQRLMDAIETISEGFSLYDSDDRLVVCNTRYRILLYPHDAEEIVPGMSFESIIRRAARRGYVKDADGRVDEWVAERLTRHRQPSDVPHLQRRSDDSWVLISERKTRDGGTVGVYSDVTELKQREGELARKSNALEQLSNQLAKYLSPQVYESIFSGRQEVKISSSRKKLTVFFSDIVGFTETADRLESEELTLLLNEYLTEMSVIALEHGATIDKFIGDAIVIFFGDPESRGAKDDALACVKMAIAMRTRMRELRSAWRDRGIERPLRLRTGINTGYCTVGNFGSKDRMDYTIIGGGVNLAARLEAAAEPDEILISYETYAHVKDEVFCEERGEIKVKGLAYPVATYQVVDFHHRLAHRRPPIRRQQPNLKLDLDLDAMSAEERAEAAKLLRQALDSLSPDGNAGPAPPSTKSTG